MSRVKDGNYITIQSFMVKDLGLKGNELLTYAIIYGFSQNGQSFNGSLQYLADWLNCSKQCAISNLKSLCEKKLIAKTDIERNGVKFCEYRSIIIDGIQNSLPPIQNSLTVPGQNSLTVPGQNSLPNNISSYSPNPNSASDNTNTCGKAGQPCYDEFCKVYNSTCTNLPHCRVCTDDRKKAIRAFLKEFTLDQWQEICQRANKSSFLTGGGSRGWKADIDFLLKPDKAAKIWEGGYQEDRKEDPARMSEKSAEERWGVVGSTL